MFYMLRITRHTDYAVRALIYLAGREEGEVAFISDISANQDLPKSYLSKILQDLRRAGIVNSKRGASGGFTLAGSASLITLRDIIEAIEGPINLNICLARKGNCNRDEICPTHPVWREAQDTLLEVLGGKTLESLAIEQHDLEVKEGRPPQCS